MTNISISHKNQKIPPSNYAKELFWLNFYLFKLQKKMLTTPITTYTQTTSKENIEFSSHSFTL